MVRKSIYGNQLKTLPDEWYLPKATTNEEAELMRAYINKNQQENKSDWVLESWTVEDCKVYHAVFKSGKYYGGYSSDDVCRKFTKISIEEFKFYILNYEEPEPEIEEDLTYLVKMINNLKINAK